MRLSVPAVAMLAVAACSHNAAVSVAPAVNVYTEFADKLPGKFGVYVNAEAFASKAEKSTWECSAHKFPLDARSAFKESAVRTSEQILEQIEVLDEPLKGDQIKARGLTAVVIFEGTLFRPKIDVDQNFWSSDVEASVDIGLLAEIYGPSGRVMSSRVGATGRSEKDAGAFCGGGGKALGNAAELAIEDALERTAERIGNSAELRNLVASNTAK